MKKNFETRVLAVAACAMLLPITQSSVSSVSKNGMFSATDAVSLQNWLLCCTNTLSDWEQSDLDGNGRLGVLDLVLMKNLLLNPNTNLKFADLQINEICAANAGVLTDSSGASPDWIELYNAGSSEMDLSGIGLSDGEKNRYKFTFPSGTKLKSHGFLLVLCDDTDEVSDSEYHAPFKLSASGETVYLTAPTGETIKELSFPELLDNESYGQYPDGSSDFFVLPGTPSSKNTAPQNGNAVMCPEFSAEGGFYDSAFQLTLTASKDSKIFYTTDGSVPSPDSSDSKQYTGSITVQDRTDSPNVLSARTDISVLTVNPPKNNVMKASVIRAVAVDASGNVSKPITKTYFVGKTSASYFKTMKVISLVTDQKNLFDDEIGIYVKGNVYTSKEYKDKDGVYIDKDGNIVKRDYLETNYKQTGKEWEREACIEVFDSGESVLAQTVGIRIRGGATRIQPQKSFSVFARSEYGGSSLNYDFFDGQARKQTNGKKIKSFDSIALRNGGNDYGKTWFRDSINQQLIADRNFGCQATDACVVFLDGEFWGVYQLTERICKDYIRDHYGIPASDAVIIKNTLLEEGSAEDLREWDSLSGFNGFCFKNDMSIASNYQHFTDMVDVQNYIDYFAAQIYWNNQDWPHNNTALWKSSVKDPSNPYADGKWRMLMFDTEYSLGLYGSDNTSATFDTFKRIASNTHGYCKMFTALLKNQEFAQQFGITIMDLANNNFAPEKTTTLIEEMSNKLATPITDTRTRFNTGSSGGNFDTIRDFYIQRSEAIPRIVSQNLGIDSAISEVKIQNDVAKGSVKLNTLTLTENEWSGRYFDAYPITVTAVPNDSASFVRWEVKDSNGKITSYTDETISVAVKGGIEIKAVYSD